MTLEDALDSDEPLTKSDALDVVSELGKHGIDSESCDVLESVEGSGHWYVHAIPPREYGDPVDIYSLSQCLEWLGY